MRKWFKFQALTAAVLLAVIFAFAAQAATVSTLTAAEAAAKGATHVVEITYADLTETTTNTAQTLGSIFAVQDKLSVKLIQMQLKTAFSYSTTNGFNVTALTVGDGTDADLFLTSTELNGNGTEVWLKAGRSTGDSTTGSAVSNLTAVSSQNTSISNTTGITLQTVTTNFIDEAGETNTFVMVTNAVLTQASASVATNLSTTFDPVTALTAITSSVGEKVYTGDDYVDFTFTPTAMPYSLSQLDAGKVWLYFLVQDAAN